MKPLSLSIVIPVFNEELRLAKTFAELEDFFSKGDWKSLEVIFVDDGSTDKTAEMIKKLKFRYPVKLISYKENRGKGYAVRHGMLAAEGDYALTIDADMSTSLTEVSKTIPLMASDCPVIIGTRKAKGSRMIPPQPFLRKKLGEGYTMLARFITGVKVSDFTCGFKCFSRQAREKVFREAAINRWSYDAEILFLAKKSGFKICEVPVVWRNDRDTRVRLGKDILGSFIDLIKIRFRRRNR